MAHRSFAILTVALLLTATGCLGAAVPEAADTGAADDATAPAVTVSGTGTVSVDPDLAVVQLAVEATADSADAARGQVAADVEAVREALAAQGVADDAVETTYFRIDPLYDVSGERRELVGYRAVHALTVETAVGAAGAVVDAAVGAGASRVEGVQFTLTDETRQSARERAIGRAMAAAAGDAGAIADAASLTLAGVRSVSTGPPVVHPVDGRVAMAEDGAGSTTIDAGPVTVTASVQVVYAVQ